MKEGDLQKLRDTLSVLDLELVDLSSTGFYRNRKAGAWAVRKKKDFEVLCVYSTPEKIRDWLKSKF